jgi:hypothetical protein
MKSEYDLYSAITFLLVGLGIGSVLAIVFNPKQRVAPGEIDSLAHVRVAIANGTRGASSVTDCGCWRVPWFLDQGECNDFDHRSKWKCRS